MWDLHTIKRLNNEAAVREQEKNREIADTYLTRLTTSASVGIRTAAKKLLACVI